MYTNTNGNSCLGIIVIDRMMDVTVSEAPVQTQQ